METRERRLPSSTVTEQEVEPLRAVQLRSDWSPAQPGQMGLAPSHGPCGLLSSHPLNTHTHTTHLHYVRTVSYSNCNRPGPDSPTSVIYGTAAPQARALPKAERHGRGAEVSLAGGVTQGLLERRGTTPAELNSSGPLQRDGRKRPVATPKHRPAAPSRQRTASGLAGVPGPSSSGLGGGPAVCNLTSASMYCSVACIDTASSRFCCSAFCRALLDCLYFAARSVPDTSRPERQASRVPAD